MFSVLVLRQISFSSPPLVLILPGDLRFSLMQSMQRCPYSFLLAPRYFEFLLAFPSLSVSAKGFFNKRKYFLIINFKLTAFLKQG